MSGEFVTLIVEPSPEIVARVTDTLTSHLRLTEIYSSSSAAEALAFIAQRPRVDCIVSEIELPDMRCFDFVQQARANSGNAKDSSLLLMSNRADRETIITAAAAGANDFLVKPFSAGALVVKFKKLLNGEHLRNAERVPVLDPLVLEVVFEQGARYNAQLIDISLGGCMLQCPPFSNGGGVFDTAKVILPAEGGALPVASEVVRIERCAPKDGQPKSIKVAFQFLTNDPDTQQKLDTFIAAHNTPLF